MAKHNQGGNCSGSSTNSARGVFPCRKNSLVLFYLFSSISAHYKKQEHKVSCRCCHCHCRTDYWRLGEIKSSQDKKIAYRKEDAAMPIKKAEKCKKPKILQIHLEFMGFYTIHGNLKIFSPMAILYDLERDENIARIANAVHCHS